MSVCRVRGPGTELLHTLFGVVGLDRRIAMPGSALAKQALVSALSVMSSATAPSCGMAR
jgi:hypothetical protein